MKVRKTIFFVLSGVSAALAVVHAANRFIFSSVSHKNCLNGVWKSPYGNIAFTQKGKGEPLLLVHGVGIGAGCHEWESGISRFCGHYKVYAIDLPGFGNSHKGNITYNSYYYASIINEFIKEVIGEKVNVIALNASSGFVLAGARLRPYLYNKIMTVNPYDKGLGAHYEESSFVKAMLPLPIIGTLVYNFISSKQSILSFFDKIAPVSHNYSEVTDIMQKQYSNAHRFGADNKYCILSFIKGFLNTPIYYLIKNCPVALCVLISGGSPMPLIGDADGIAVEEIKECEFYPNIYAPNEFDNVVKEFFESKGVCEG